LLSISRGPLTLRRPQPRRDPDPGAGEIGHHEVWELTKLDRLARSLRDAGDVVDELTARQVKLNLGGSVHDPTDPVGRLLFNVLAMVAEFQADLIRIRAPRGRCR
jgi:DNA invertase Pin-like site-specific DNA recombinase